MRAGSCETVVLAFPPPPWKQIVCRATSCQGQAAYAVLPSVEPLTRDSGTAEEG
ncbi:MAG: hypothetical protein ICV54_16740 [Nostoc sp. C3-bin3]|nr:hypothetical protein [Nostoc sp. C3-bin3]